jgi:type 2 lantibiotic biosynthesis protein LanM
MTASLPRDRDVSLREIAARAASFSERRALKFTIASAPTERRTLWQQAVAPVDADAFARRLHWDDIDDAAAGEMLADAAWHADQALPRWTTLLAALYDVPADGDSLASLRADPVIVAADPVAFEELHVRAIRYARHELAEHTAGAHARFSAAALLDFERALFKRIAALSQRALYAAFTEQRVSRPGNAIASLFSSGGGIPRAEYEAFVAGQLADGLMTFFQSHAVAGRLVAIAVNQWLGATTEVMTRFAADAPALGPALGIDAAGEIARVTCDSGDTHDEGRAVAILECASGQRVVYKPRALSLESLWCGLVDWYNGTSPARSLRAARILERDSYGWVEFIPRRSCATRDEAAAYYERSGATLALVYAVNGNDFHLENIIPHGADPVLIDHEALLTPSSVLDLNGHDESSDYLATVARLTSGTLARTGLLPMIREVGPSQAVVEIGGLMSTDSTGLQATMVHWKHVNTDLMKIGYQHVAPPTPGHTPMLDGSPMYAAEFADDIARGFDEAYRVIAAERGAVHALLDRALDAPVRVLCRHTSLYAYLLQRCLHPQFLRDGWRRSIELDVLARPMLGADKRPQAWAILAAEARSLDANDVPMFLTRADSRDLTLPTGDIIPRFFSASGVSEARRRLDSLSEADREAQLSFLRLAVASAAARGLEPFPVSPRTAAPATPTQWTATAMIDEARGIADALEQRAARSPAGMPIWMSMRYHARSGRYLVGAAGPGFFDGFGGVALAYAALAAMTGEATDEERAMKLLRILSNDALLGFQKKAVTKSVDMGIGSGMAGVAYVLAAAGELFADASLSAASTRVAHAMLAFVNRAPAGVDVYSGLSGSLLAALAVHRRTRDDALLTSAAACGKTLEAMVIREFGAVLDGKVPVDQSKLRSGVAHGASGMALAFNALARSENNDHWRGIAERLLELERQRAVAATGPSVDTWLGARGGITLNALISSSSATHDTDAPPAVTDTLARGTAGRIDRALCLAVRGDPRALATAREGAMTVVAASKQAGYELGWPSGVHPIGLCQGLAGIAYTLTRTIDPARIPSILICE